MSCGPLWVVSERTNCFSINWICSYCTQKSPHKRSRLVAQGTITHTPHSPARTHIDSRYVWLAMYMCACVCVRERLENTAMCMLEDWLFIHSWYRLLVFHHWLATGCKRPRNVLYYKWKFVEFAKKNYKIYIILFCFLIFLCLLIVFFLCKARRRRRRMARVLGYLWCSW